jgi:hypothetical protein
MEGRRRQLGQQGMFCISHAMMMRRRWEEDKRDFKLQGRMVMGFILPPWQRPFVWTEAQCIRFVESLWSGIPVGTYSYVQDYDGPFDMALIDGQQRMTALQMYLDDAFPVLGYRWSEVTDIDRRFFDMASFPAFVVSKPHARDEVYLREYYDLMNFGGTAHTQDQRASQ